MTKAPEAEPGQSQRLDQWLWFARITKSRTLAQSLIERGKVRVNKQKVERSSYGLKAGDTITFSSGPRVRVFTVKAFGARRGPAVEAQALYEELTPAADGTKSTVKENADTSHALASGIRPEGAGRPTKRERRQTERLKDRFRDC
ncbi:MAG: RNA-binding S4 domain-containing protein [Hyphomicrobium sp.]|nr:RNA-binding S4 domain-containing protein [Hyphomicrobium sp.]